MANQEYTIYFEDIKDVAVFSSKPKDFTVKSEWAFFEGFQSFCNTIVVDGLTTIEEIKDMHPSALFVEGC